MSSYMRKTYFPYKLKKLTDTVINIGHCNTYHYRHHFNLTFTKTKLTFIDNLKCSVCLPTVAKLARRIYCS